MSTIIDDWLRQHPKLTLTRDQREDLEQLIDEEIDDNDFSCEVCENYDEDAVKAQAFKAGAEAMQKNVVKLFADAADNCGPFLGLGNALGVLSDDLEKLPIPEMPEEEGDDDAED